MPARTIIQALLAAFFIILTITSFSACLQAAQTDSFSYNERTRVEWLEIYTHIIQKLIFLCVVAFITIRFNWFRSVVMREKFDMDRAAAGTAAVLTLSGIIGCLIGYLRYGAADWGFFDVQLILTLVTGFLCGRTFGVASGFVGAAFRTMLGEGSWVYWLLLIAAGLCSSLFWRTKHASAFDRRRVIIMGLSLFSLHGLTTFAPLGRSMGFSSALSLMVTVLVMEMLGTYVFMAIQEGFLSDERRRLLEKLLPEMRLKFLQAQINPHFLFNTLNTIAAICLREQADQARGLVLKLSHFFRRILKLDKDWIRLEEEVEHTDAYIEIEKARFQDKLSVSKDIRLSQMALDAKVPVLILQPIVENAIKHGVASLPKGGHVSIFIKETAGDIDVQIEDNGVGIEKSKLDELALRNDENTNIGDMSGIGLKNINERLRHTYGPNATLKIKSVIGQGTVVRFRIPIKL